MEAGLWTPSLRIVPANGRLTPSQLAAIPGGQLVKPAAAAWNAMHAEAMRKYGVSLRPLGPASSYRTYAEQVYLWNHVAHAHDTNWVAYPGTSNHGLGLAVDLASHAMRLIIDAIGAQYGWAKKWSDAPVEWWHIRWKAGVWKGKAPFAALRSKSTGDRVKWVQRRLRAKGFKSVPAAHKSGYGFFGRTTISAVKRFQKAHGLTQDGVVGKATWLKLAT